MTTVQVWELFGLLTVAGLMFWIGHVVSSDEGLPETPVGCAAMVFVLFIAVMWAGTAVSLVIRYVNRAA
jgi:hypothetical protein